MICLVNSVHKRPLNLVRQGDRHNRPIYLIADNPNTLIRTGGYAPTPVIDIRVRGRGVPAARDRAVNTFH